MWVNSRCGASPSGLPPRFRAARRAKARRQAESLTPLLLLLAVFASGAEIPRPEHPRPDFRRDQWVNLNGSWEFRFDPQALTLEVQDFGSRNGTYLNGQKVDNLETSLRDEGCEDKTVSSCNVLTVGGTTLRLDVVQYPTEALEEGNQPGAWSGEAVPVA